MDDMTPFEELFEERLRAFARTGVKAVDSAEVARAAAVGTQRRPRRIPWGFGGSADDRPLAGRRGGRHRGDRGRRRVVHAPAPPARGDRGSDPDAERGAQPQPSGRRAASELDPQRASHQQGRPRPPSRSGGRLDRHRDDGHASLLATPRCGSSMAGCSWRAAPTATRTTPPRSCTTRTAGPGPPPGTWSSPTHGFPATLLRDGKVLVGDVDDPDADEPVSVRRCTTRPAGPGPPPGRWSQEPIRHGHAAARRQGARHGSRWRSQLYDPDSGTWTATGKMVTAERRGHAAILLPDGKVLVAAAGDAINRRTCLRPSCTIRPRGPGPRSRPCTAPRQASRPRCCATARCS